MAKSKTPFQSQNTADVVAKKYRGKVKTMKGKLQCRQQVLEYCRQVQEATDRAAKSTIQFN